MKHIGRSLPRLEDKPLVTGRGRFAADISFPHQLHMRVVRSPVAHGKLGLIDASAALVLNGVFAVWTAADVADIPPIGIRLSRIEGLDPYRQPILARDRVRYVGEPVALVFAADPYVAEDAADLVDIAIEPLDPILSPQGEPGAFGPGLSNEPAIIRKGYGDVAAAFAEAAVTVELELAVGRHSGVPLETRGAVARYEAARDMLEIYGAAKVPHWNRDTLAAMLGRAPSTVHLFEGHVGGGFGVRGELYPEDVLVALAALRLGRPVKWIEDRREHLMAANQSRDQVHHVRAAATADGRLLAIEDEFWHDQGAYIRTHGTTVPDLAAAMLPGPYVVPAYQATGHVRLTNKTPCGTYRAPGRFESSFVRERLMDALAEKIGIDRIEIRRRNFVPAAMMPYKRPLNTLGTEIVLDSGDYGRLLDRLLMHLQWPEFCGAIETRRGQGECVGYGLGIFVEKSGLGPFDGVRVTVDSAGRVEIVTGAASLGQGVETVMAQICAEKLDVDYRNIGVVHGRTDRFPEGMGAFASRVTVMTGTATWIAAGKLRDKAIDMAAELLQAKPAALTIADGRVVYADRLDGPSITLAEVARALSPVSRLRGNRDPGLSAEGWFYTEHMTYPYGIHFAVVRVDRETGNAVVERFVIAYDIGKAVNPMLVEGQIAGGLLQGIGGALLEEMSYDAQGQPVAVTFADYLMPTIGEMPQIETILTEDAPSPLNP
ncbi:MAG TPA: xanthine dehydrogenase family protein molybdopterin-binding subunit, partial [Stellaceae bacterium]|nr:xanthine dehydrogenase family protein molybdopterin-binding subunit [Stellaceae bacterium]